MRGKRRINMIYEREEYYVSLEADILKGTSSVFCHILRATVMFHEETEAAAANQIFTVLWVTFIYRVVTKSNADVGVELSVGFIFYFPLLSKPHMAAPPRSVLSQSIYIVPFPHPPPSPALLFFFFCIIKDGTNLISSSLSLP